MTFSLRRNETKPGTRRTCFQLVRPRRLLRSQRTWHVRSMVTELIIGPGTTSTWMRSFLPIQLIAGGSGAWRPTWSETIRYSALKLATITIEGLLVYETYKHTQNDFITRTKSLNDHNLKGSQ